MADLVTQPTAAPTRKVKYGAIAGTISALLIQLLAPYSDQFPILATSEFTAFLPVAIGYAFSYIVKEAA